jgi:hypothetical protein
MRWPKRRTARERALDTASRPAAISARLTSWMLRTSWASRAALPAGSSCAQAASMALKAMSRAVRAM